MTGVEVILAALAAGTGVGVSDAAKAAVLDAYTGLRDVLRRRLASREGPQEMVDVAPDETGAWKADLAAELERSAAAEDAAILDAARRVLTLADPAGIAAGKYRVDVRDAKGVQVGDHNTQHNTFS
ncbi:RIP homotypic interaction motif-containing protein [Phytohabitans houttuyneae]|uniref:RIP homotypic interaction motif-containing protein n=1 Tax=Phytohabitans houttuyneae TaxID=1076126 RepID=UPI0015640117|nr:RIP homotypic interaction motif-containing protein [Phytohabitans houttuyneae]